MKLIFSLHIMHFSLLQALGIDTEDDIHQLASYFLKAGMLQPDVPEEPKAEPITAEAQVIAEMVVSGDLYRTVYRKLEGCYWIHVQDWLTESCVGTVFQTFQIINGKFIFGSCAVFCMF